MKKTIVAMLAVFGLLVSANANLISNGDFEADGFAAGGNNVVTAIDSWTGTENVDGDGRYDSGNSGIPDLPNTVIRLTGGKSIYQSFTTTWDADSTFTVSFNACNVPWKLGTEPGVWASLRSATGFEYKPAALANTFQTHDGSSAYPDWTEDMSFSFEFSGATLISAGASANDELRVNFYSKGTANSINWLDNVDVTVIPEPATMGMVGMFGISVLFIRRRFMI